MAAGLNGEALVCAIERIEGELPSHTRSARQDRNARYYQNMRLKRLNSDESDVSDAPLPPKEIPPKPPKEITPNPHPPSPPKGGSSPKAFDEFWLAYPRKVGKGAARKAYDRSLAKLRPDHANPAAVLLLAVQRAKLAWDDPDFIPHPATWLNQERWEDEPELPTPQMALWQTTARSNPLVSREVLTDEQLRARIAQEAEELAAKEIH